MRLSAGRGAAPGPGWRLPGAGCADRRL